jgi:hypothetical protein
LVAISVATPLNLSKTRDLITRIKSLEHPPSILIGGAAVNSNPELWKHLAADGASADVSDGVDMANRLVRQRKPDRTQQTAR